MPDITKSKIQKYLYDMFNKDYTQLEHTASLLVVRRHAKDILNGKRIDGNLLQETKDYLNEVIDDVTKMINQKVGS